MKPSHLIYLKNNEAFTNAEMMTLNILFTGGAKYDNYLNFLDLRV